MVSARSDRMGPKLRVERTKVPVVGVELVGEAGGRRGQRHGSELSGQRDIDETGNQTGTRC